MGFRGPHIDRRHARRHHTCISPMSMRGSPLALENGATEKRPVQNQFYGDRSGTIVDPFGHIWTIATHIEDVAPEEMNRRFEAEMKKMPA